MRVLVGLGIVGQLVACAHASSSSSDDAEQPGGGSMVEPCPEATAPTPPSLALSGTVWSVERGSGSAARYRFFADGTMETTAVGGLLHGTVLSGVLWRQAGACATLSFNNGFMEERVVLAADGQTLTGVGANVRGKKWNVQGRRGERSPAEIAEKQKFRGEKVNLLVDGQSTRNDVLLLLGAPRTMAPDPTNPTRETWQYEEKPDGSFAITVVMENGVVTSHARAPSR